MTASPSDGHQAGYWGGFDPEDAVDFTRAWLTDSPGPTRSQQLATWLDTRQARVELLPTEAALEPGHIRLRHGTIRPDAFRLHPGQFFATGADTGYGYARSPGHPDGAVIPIDVPRSALQQASMDTPMPHTRPGHDPGGLARARRRAGPGVPWVINTTFSEVASLRAAAYTGAIVHRPIPAALIRSHLDDQLQQRTLAAAGSEDLNDPCLLCGADRPHHEAGCPVPARTPGATDLSRGKRSRAGLGL